MDIDKVLLVVEDAIKPNYLNRAQELVLRHTLAGKTYSEIAVQHNYDMEYIKYVGCELWRLLSKAFGEPVNKTNFSQYIKHCLQTDSHQSKPIENQTQPETNSQEQCYFDWGTAPDVSNFKGRTEELQQLKKWALDKSCRLISLLGPMGIGKTALATYFGEQFSEHFQFILWRSLSTPPPFEEFLNSILNTLRLGRELVTQMTIHEKILHLLNFMRQHRCLLIFDGLEALLEGGVFPSPYHVQYQDYDRFLRLLVSSRHQSLVIVTSSEKAKGLSPYEEDGAQVIILTGLPTFVLQEIFQQDVQNWGSNQDWQILFDRYDYNPKFIKTVLTTIQEIFQGQLSIIQDQNFICQEIHILLKSQFERLPSLEKELLGWLLIEQSPCTNTQLMSRLVEPASYTRCLEALVYLQQQGWIDKNEERYVLKFLSMNFLTYTAILRLVRDTNNSD